MHRRGWPRTRRLRRWIPALAGIATLVAGGQAVGPAVADVVSGSAGATVEQAVLLGGPPALSGADDGAAATSDERTRFTVALETQAGQRQGVSLPLENESGRTANAVVQIRPARGLNVDARGCAGTSAAHLAPTRWLATVDGRAGGSAFVTSIVAEDLGSVAVTGRVDVAAVDACTLFAASYDANTGDFELRKSLDGGMTWGSPLVLETGPASANSAVAVDAPSAEVAYVALVVNETAGSDEPSDKVVVKRVAAAGTALREVASETVDAGAGDPVSLDNQASVAIAAPGEERFFLSWVDLDSNNKNGVGGRLVTVVAGTASGGGITTGSSVNVESSASNLSTTSLAAPDASTLFVSWFDSTGGGVKLSLLSASGSSLNVEATPTVDDEAGDSAVSAVAAADASTAFVVWHDSDERLVEARTVTNSGGSLGLGTPLTLDTNAGEDSDVAVDMPSASDAFVAWFVDGTGDLLFEKLAVTGTSVSEGEEVSIDEEAGPNGNVAVTAPGAGNVFVGYFDDASDDTFGVAASGNGLRITIEAEDDVPPGFSTLEVAVRQAE